MIGAVAFRLGSFRVLVICLIMLSPRGLEMLGAIGLCRGGRCVGCDHGRAYARHRKGGDRKGQKRDDDGPQLAHET
jgi:hypothetical protein